MTRWVLAAVAMALLSCGGSAPVETTPTGGGSTVVLRVPVGTSPVSGPADAWVTIVTFSDFQCPFCAAVQPTLATVLPEFGSDVRLVFKNFPLTSLHAHALEAALAAQCAHAQGKFWAFHDRLFASQAAVFGAADVGVALAGVAAQVGLDVAAWETCRAAPATQSAVLADMQTGARFSIAGTPSFVVNGTLVAGAQPAATFRSAIAAARDRAVASGVPASQYYDTVILGQ